MKDASGEGGYPATHNTQGIPTRRKLKIELLTKWVMLCLNMLKSGVIESKPPGGLRP
jgi:hypothetical protein